MSFCKSKCFFLISLHGACVFFCCCKGLPLLCHSDVESSNHKCLKHGFHPHMVCIAIHAYTTCSPQSPRRVFVIQMYAFGSGKNPKAVTNYMVAICLARGAGKLICFHILRGHLHFNRTKEQAQSCSFSVARIVYFRTCSRICQDASF